MKLLEGLRLEIGYTEKDVVNAIAKKCKIQVKDIKRYEIIKESIDARRKPEVYYNLNVAFDTDHKLDNLKDIDVSHAGIVRQNINYNGARPIVVGFGPAGMMMALKLAKSGLNPIVIEQGDSVDERKLKIDKFWQKGTLDTFSNVHFGEGGAGTFSDGKLNSNVSNEYCKIVTNEFIIHGAPKEIFYKSKPHIGTDNLVHMVKNIRNDVITSGGEVRFRTRLIDILIDNGMVYGITVQNEKAEIETIESNTVILAVGHSAKNVFDELKQKNIAMEQKPFAIGVRIEQSQEDINMSQYGIKDDRLPAADYKLVEHLDNGRSVFTFCMCPGGVVVASSSQEGTIVTNGMSYFARDGRNANSAILVNVTPEDFKSDDVLAGFDMINKYEKAAFDIAGKSYYAPCQTVGSFLNVAWDKDKVIEATYRPGVEFKDLSQCLPDFVVESIRNALPKFEKKIKNFAKPENLLIAVESRSSCPVKIVRDANLSTSVKGLFAIGEGAGYAGGIMSSAQDGLKVADRVIDYMLSNKNA